MKHSNGSRRYNPSLAHNHSDGGGGGGGGGGGVEMEGKTVPALGRHFTMNRCRLCTSAVASRK